MKLLIISPQPPDSTLNDALHVAGYHVEWATHLERDQAEQAHVIAALASPEMPLAGIERLQDEGVETPVVLILPPEMKRTEHTARRLSCGLKYVVDAPAKAPYLLLELHRARYPKANAPGLNPQQIIHTRMQLMRAIYSEVLLLRIRDLERDLNSLQGEHTSYQQIYIKVHNLKGTAGTYGFMQVSEVAERLERALTSGREARVSPSALKQLTQALYHAREREL